MINTAKLFKTLPFRKLLNISGVFTHRDILFRTCKNLGKENQSNVMVVRHNVKGYEEFSKLLEELEGSGQTIHVLFSGGKDENGESWCPYCVKGNKKLGSLTISSYDHLFF